MSLKLEIYMLNKTIWTTDAEKIILPAPNGLLEILPGHIKLITALEIGALNIKTSEELTYMLVVGGVAYIENNKVSIFSTRIEKVLTWELDSILLDLEETKKQLLNAPPNAERLKIESSKKIKILLAKIRIIRNRVVL
jgi:F-type H+-transporting ATPase subunit epsilon